MNKKFDSKGAFLIYLKSFLHQAYADHKKVLLIIDEAQRLNHELLEQIRLLSNIELQNRKLINIFFVGQPEFNEMLVEDRNRALRQRITVSYHINPLTEPEAHKYIEHRLKIAGATREIFAQDAVREIFSFSGGYPRLINIICDHALLTGYASDLKIIDKKVIKECERELQIPVDLEPEDDNSRRYNPASQKQRPTAATVKALQNQTDEYHCCHRHAGCLRCIFFRQSKSGRFTPLVYGGNCPPEIYRGNSPKIRRG